MNSDSWDYVAAGFDKYLSRGDTPNLGNNLDQNVPNNSMAADRTQITGAMGDTLRIGKIFLNGSDGNIVANDGTNDFLIIGDDGTS